MNEQRAGRSSIGRVAALGATGVVVSGALAGLPNDAIVPALFGVAILGVVGGSLARSRREVAALVVGGVAGGFGIFILTLGKPNGPSSVASLVFDVIIIAVILGAFAVLRYAFRGGRVLEAFAVLRYAFRGGRGRSRRPHDDPLLEAFLPSLVAGRSLDRWSIAGSRYPFQRVLGNHEDLRAIEGKLETIGLPPRDVSFGFAGRASLDDPRYSITVSPLPWGPGGEGAGSVRLEHRLRGRRQPGAR